MLAKEKNVELDQLGWRLGSPHDLRKTFGTRMARVLPIHELKRLMGHAKIETTADYYLEVGEIVPAKLQEAFPSLGGAGNTSGDTEDNPP